MPTFASTLDHPEFFCAVGIILGIIVAGGGWFELTHGKKGHKKTEAYVRIAIGAGMVLVGLYFLVGSIEKHTGKGGGGAAPAGAEGAES